MDLCALCRRYQCQACGALLLVVPREVVPWRRYTAAAIAWALALWGHCRRPVTEVRRRTSTTPAPAGFGEPGRWASLRRWVAAAVSGDLFPAAKLRRLPMGEPVRTIAGRIARTLAAHALPTVRLLPIEAQAFHGGAAMA